MTGPVNPWVPPADAVTTDSTASLYSAIRALLLAYEDPATTTPYQIAALLAASGGGQARIYVRNVPNVNNVKYPYATLLIDRTTILGSNGYGERANLEVQIVANPAAQGPLAEWIADRFDRCLLSMRLSSAAGQSVTDFGIVTCRSRQRQTMPPFTTPADGNTYGVRMVYELWLYPRVLTSRSEPAPP